MKMRCLMRLLACSSGDGCVRDGDELEISEMESDGEPAPAPASADAADTAISAIPARRTEDLFALPANDIGGYYAGRFDRCTPEQQRARLGPPVDETPKPRRTHTATAAPERRVGILAANSSRARLTRAGNGRGVAIEDEPTLRVRRAWVERGVRGGRRRRSAGGLRRARGRTLWGDLVPVRPGEHRRGRGRRPGTRWRGRLGGWLEGSRRRTRPGSGPGREPGLRGRAPGPGPSRRRVWRRSGRR